MAKSKKELAEDAGDIAENASLEDIMARVETLIEEMEKPDAPLEATIQMFEDAMQQIKLGQQVLENAEQRVRVLMEEDMGDELAGDDD